MFKSIHSENKQFGTKSTKMAVHYEHFWFPKKEIAVHLMIYFIGERHYYTYCKVLF